MELLDNPVWAALSGAPSDQVVRHGRGARFDPAVSPFGAVADPRDPAAWADLATLLAPGEHVLVPGPGLTTPAGWTGEAGLPGLQLVGHDYEGAPAPEAVVLGPGDVPEMLDLRERTRPGPFLKRTIELGTYLGIRRGGALVAMAGERLHVPGYTEISAVCTDPAYRGAGLATRLIGAVAAGIRARGEVPFLHCAADNLAAVRLYENLGFSVRTEMAFLFITPA